MVKCDCYGCWFTGKQNACGAFTCDHCGEDGPDILETLDVDDNGRAVRERCRNCQREQVS